LPPIEISTLNVRAQGVMGRMYELRNIYQELVIGEKYVFPA
jgi:hypothetical protein